MRLRRIGVLVFGLMLGGVLGTVFWPRESEAFFCPPISPVINPSVMAAQNGMTQMLMKEIQKAAREQIKGLQDSFKQKIKAQVEQYKAMLDFKQRPTQFCDTQTQVPEATGQATAIGAYNRTTGYHLAVNSRVRSDPHRAQKDLLETVRKQKRTSARGGSACRPGVPLPVASDAVEDLDACASTDEVTTVLLAGTANVPRTTEEEAGLAEESPAGQEYALDQRNLEARRNLAVQAISKASNPETRAMLRAYRDLFSQLTPERLSEQTATGGLERDETILMQVRAKLMVERLAATLEQNRLLGVLLARRLDERATTLQARLPRITGKP